MRWASAELIFHGQKPNSPCAISSSLMIPSSIKVRGRFATFPTAKAMPLRGYSSLNFSSIHLSAASSLAKGCVHLPVAAHEMTPATTLLETEAEVVWRRLKRLQIGIKEARLPLDRSKMLALPSDTLG